MCTLSNGDIFNDLHWPLTLFSRSWHIWSRISQKQCVLATKLHSTLIGNHTEHMEWYHVWWACLTSKCIERFVNDSWVSCSYNWSTAESSRNLLVKETRVEIIWLEPVSIIHGIRRLIWPRMWCYHVVKEFTDGLVPSERLNTVMQFWKEIWIYRCKIRTL